MDEGGKDFLERRLGFGKDLLQQMQALCAERDMAALAQLWVQGGKVEWQRAHSGPIPAGMSLPTYPFARERHWIVDIADTAAAARPSASSAPSRLTHLLRECLVRAHGVASTVL